MLGFTLEGRARVGVRVGVLRRWEQWSVGQHANIVRCQFLGCSENGHSLLIYKRKRERERELGFNDTLKFANKADLIPNPNPNLNPNPETLKVGRGRYTSK